MRLRNEEVGAILDPHPLGLSLPGLPQFHTAFEGGKLLLSSKSNLSLELQQLSLEAPAKKQDVQALGGVQESIAVPQTGARPAVWVTHREQLRNYAEAGVK